MGKVIVANWVTLDGVMQGPGSPDEDSRDGFEHGGWATPYGDETTIAKMGERMGDSPPIHRRFIAICSNTADQNSARSLGLVE
jgi:hypothetical protein